MKEKELVIRIMHGLKAIGAYAAKYHVSGPFAAAGTPDILACVGGVFVAIECKVGKNTTTPMQEKTLSDIRMAGGCAIVVFSLDELVAKFNQFNIPIDEDAFLHNATVKKRTTPIYED